MNTVTASLDNYATYPQLVRAIPGVLSRIESGGKAYVTAHVTYEEIRCRCGRAACKKVDWSQVIHPEIMTAFELIRAEYNKKHEGGIIINSGCRCLNHQEDLRRLGYETAKGMGPHCPAKNQAGIWHTWALDMGIPRSITPDRFESLVEFVDHGLRIGFLIYKKSIVHIDCAYRYNGPDKPVYWRPGERW